MLYCVDDEEDGQRLDRVLSRKSAYHSPNVLHGLIRKRAIRVNGLAAKHNMRLNAGDEVLYPDFLAQGPKNENEEQNRPLPQCLKSEYSKLQNRILYESEGLLVLNKPPGLAVHSGTHIRYGIIELFKRFHPIGNKIELVHRLDRPTSGVLLLCKSLKGLRALHSQFREHTIQKRYLALVHGSPNFKDKHVYSTNHDPVQKSRPHGGLIRPQDTRVLKSVSETYFKVLERYGSTACLMEARPSTGRTHQIRIHASGLGLPILGDEGYAQTEAQRRWIRSQKHFKKGEIGLHAYSIQFEDPDTRQNTQVTAPCSDSWDRLIQALKQSRTHPSKADKRPLSVEGRDLEPELL